MKFIAECALPNPHDSNFRLRAYRCEASGEEIMAMFLGDVSGGNVLCRIHDQCFTSEVLGSLRCDCKGQLDTALQRVASEGRGLVIYLQQEGRGIGLANKVAAYSVQDDTGMDTVDANVALGEPVENRTYEMIPDILSDLRISSIRLMTNNPFKLQNLERLGVCIEERIALVVDTSEHAEGYMRCKRDKMGHLF